MSKDKFFIVFSPEGETPPKVTYPTHQAAFYAAAKMAEYKPDASFFVMGSKSSAVGREDASAGEAGTAETPESGSVHEHAMPKADAQ